jgi:hypothetical protein
VKPPFRFTPMLLALFAGLTAFAACTKTNPSAIPSDGGTEAMSSETSTDAMPPTDAGMDAPNTPPLPFPDGAPLPTGQVDRAGRPLINIALNYNVNALEDEYNQEATIQDWTANRNYDPSFEANLTFYDSWDGQNDWTPADGGVDPLVKPLELDVLLVNTAVTCTAANDFCETGYLDNERELLYGTTPSTCGGLTPNEDAISKTLTYFVTAGFAGCSATSSTTCAVSQGVAQATQPATHTFPYLQPPN